MSDIEELDYSEEMTTDGSGIQLGDEYNPRPQEELPTDGSSGELDYSKELPTDGSGIQLGDEYDPRPQEDAARRVIAYLLIGLLWVLVGSILILVAFKIMNLSEVKELSVVLGPVVTLVSAATGFYYGTKSKN